MQPYNVHFVYAAGTRELWARFLPVLGNWWEYRRVPAFRPGGIGSGGGGGIAARGSDKPAHRPGAERADRDRDLV